MNPIEELLKWVDEYNEVETIDGSEDLEASVLEACQEIRNNMAAKKSHMMLLCPPHIEKELLDGNVKTNYPGDGPMKEGLTTGPIAGVEVKSHTELEDRGVLMHRTHVRMDGTVERPDAIVEIEFGEVEEL